MIISQNPPLSGLTRWRYLPRIASMFLFCYLTYCYLQDKVVRMEYGNSRTIHFQFTIHTVNIFSVFFDEVICLQDCRNWGREKWVSRLWSECRIMGLFMTQYFGKIFSIKESLFFVIFESIPVPNLFNFDSSSNH